jgi:DNA-directed RNA polymerase subunit RPC12/RpoP
MKTTIEGIVVDATPAESGRPRYVFSVRLPNGQELLWKLRQEDVFQVRIPRRDVGDAVGIVWDDEAYTARLIVSDLESFKLVRDFDRAPDGDPAGSEKVELLKCPSCGGTVPLGEGEIAECIYCAAKVPMSGAHLDAARLSADLRKANERLFGELTEIFAGGMKPALFKVVSVVPLILFTLQILLIAYGTFFSDRNDFFSDEVVNDFLMEDYNFALCAVLPSMAITIVAVFLGRKNAFATDIRFLSELVSPTTRGRGELLCRNCESPLRSAKLPDLVVCPYCRTENLVMGGSRAREKASGLLNMSYLTDVKILHGEFKLAYRKYFAGLAIGFLVFYGSFFAYSCYWEDVEDVHFVVHYVAMPLVVLILFHLLSEIALLPFFRFGDWPPKHFQKRLREQAPAVEDKEGPLYNWIIPIIKSVLSLLFFVTLFFMR